MHVAPQTQATPGARRRYRLAIAAAALLLFAVSLLWGLNLPHHEGPDELRHINSVARLADDRGWPLPYEAPMLASVRVAQAENGRPPIEGQSARPQVDPVDRSIFIGEVDASDRGLDNMVQHPPGYYAIAAFAVKAAEIAGLRWDQASIALRALSAALVAGSVPFIIGAVRWATGRRLIGVLGGVGVLAVPAFTVLGGYVSNDTLLVLACSATLYYLFRALRDPDAGEWVLPMAGLAYGLALFTKGIALMLGPTLAILVLIAAWRRSGSVLGAALRVLAPAVIAFAVGGWWWLRNLLLLGKLQPSLLGDRERLDEPVAGFDLGAFLTGFATRVHRLFWSRDVLPGWLEIIAVIALVGAAVAAIALRRTRWLYLAAALFPLIVTTTVLVNALGIYWDTGRPDRGAQGRYLFSSMVVLATAIGAVWVLLLRRLPERLHRPAAALGVLAPAAVPLITMPFTIDFRWGLFWQTRGALDPASGWVTDRVWFMGVPGWFTAAAIGVAAIALGGLLVAVLGLARRPVGDDARPSPSGVSR